jgi:hypothetical protein
VPLQRPQDLPRARDAPDEDRLADVPVPQREVQAAV